MPRVAPTIRDDALAMFMVIPGVGPGTAAKFLSVFSLATFVSGGPFPKYSKTANRILQAYQSSKEQIDARILAAISGISKDKAAAITAAVPSIIQCGQVDMMASFKWRGRAQPHTIARIHECLYYCDVAESTQS